MRKVIVACVAGAGTVFAASGAQAQTFSDPFGTAPVTVNWTGFYIGGQGSYEWSSVDLHFDPSFQGVGDRASLNTDGWMGGVHGGVQQQFGLWVGGVELSGDWGANGESRRLAWSIPNVASGHSSLKAEIDQIFTATARLGYLFGNTLAYAKGGYASANVSAGWSFACETGFCASVTNKDSVEKNHQGYTIGGGLAWMIAQNVSVGLDYSYINLGSKSYRYVYDDGALNPCGNCDYDQRFDVDPNDIHKISARLTFHFNGGAQPAPY